ncbi:hypothetical protein D9Q98_004336 [Chlorella vulgaris]|uniref:DUF1232 domain-containing protein n=1 Tax=Chlorella vulgaris TaxID=3077 RepID=A0A9D4TPL5_CHLVU|nr:hypothetical protein D9Q98_004336 [Chlorella vulgaris]
MEAPATQHDAEDLRGLYGDLQQQEEGAAVALPPPLPPKCDGWWSRFKGAVKAMKQEVLALNYATQDRRLGFVPRLLALLAIAYALSPLDLIPDFIPVLGLVDDFFILGLLLYLAIRMVPADVMAAARERAKREPLRLRKNWGMALLFFAIWDVTLLWLVWFLCSWVGKSHAGIQPYKVWIMAGTGVLAVAGELSWAVGQWRAEQRVQRVQAVLTAAGTETGLEEALLRGGTQAVHEYLEP